MAQNQSSLTVSMSYGAAPQPREQHPSHGSLLQLLAAQLLQIVLFKGADIRKELKIRLGLLSLFEFKTRQLDAACIIGHLRENIPSRRRIAKKAA